MALASSLSQQYDMMCHDNLSFILLKLINLITKILISHITLQNKEKLMPPTSVLVIKLIIFKYAQN